MILKLVDTCKEVLTDGPNAKFISIPATGRSLTTAARNRHNVANMTQHVNTESRHHGLYAKGNSCSPLLVIMRWPIANTNIARDSLCCF
jgi:hypothetical protein